VPLHCHHPYKGDLIHNPSHFFTAAISSLLLCALRPLHNQLLPQILPLVFLSPPWPPHIRTSSNNP
jgi:hypothetical protein